MLGDAIHEADGSGQTKVLLNLANVTFVDSSGIGYLVRAICGARKNSLNVKLLNPPAPVLALLRRTKLETVVDIHDNEAAAIASFGKASDVPRAAS